MLLFYHNQPIKNVPVKFYPVQEKLIDYIEDESTCRLTERERENFEKVLLQWAYRYIFDHYLSDLTKKYLGNSNATKLTKVTRRDGTIQFMIENEAGRRVYVSKTYFIDEPDFWGDIHFNSMQHQQTHIW